MNDYIQLAGIRGHCHNYNDKMLTDDFYTLCQKNPNKNVRLRKKSNFKHNEIIFKSLDVTIEYLCSDLVRFCLCLTKNYCNLNTGEMTLIPKQPIPVSEELREYIRDFLPDYYGIRDNVK
jgi:hypothetical protein